MLKPAPSVLNARFYLLFCLAAFLFFPTARAIEPPTPEALLQYRQDGSYAKRLEFARRLGNHRVRPDVARHSLARMRQLTAGAGAAGPKAVSAAPLPAWEGMPTKGTNNILVLLIDFPDYQHVNSAETIASKIFGDGFSSEYPRESLRNYYRRSSYGQLEIRGNVLGWYRMQHNRSWYTSTYTDENEANRAIIQEVVQAYDGTHDFSQYDNNHDGKVDYLAVLWAGPDTGWANFWWGYQWSLNRPVVADGVEFEMFSWQWESRPVGSEFQAQVLIHETGHILGLPDYYDYDFSVGPGGGVGGLDMMDGNIADHNAFSKFMLDWIQPAAIPAGSSNVTLRPMANSPEAIVMMPGYDGATPYTEFFLIENRFCTNNDTGNPGNGVLIWHVDATADSRGQDFLYNNSDTPHKLLRLMEADGLEEIERGDGKANAGDYYQQVASFSDSSRPNSRSYSGANTYITVENFSPTAPVMAFVCTIEGTSTGPQILRSPSTLNQRSLTDVNAGQQSFYVVGTGGTIGYAISKSATWLSVEPSSGTSSGQTNAHVVSYATALLAPGLYSAEITITAPGASNSPQVVHVNLTIMGNNIGHAVNATNLAWNSSGDSLWFEQNTVSQDGEAAAQSGALLDNQTNWIETTVTGPGQLSFWWKVSSEANYDFLRFLVDGQEQPGRISGFMNDWQSVSLLIPSGQHTCRWAYGKDYSVSSYLDAGWVDQVSFVPTNIPPGLVCNVTNVSQVGITGQNAAPLFIEIWNDGGSSMTYSIASDAGWVSAWPANETSSGSHNQHTIIFSSSSLPAGTYTATLTITAPGADGSPISIPVTLRIFAGGGALGEATDFTTGLWNTGGDAPWNLESSTTHDGLDAAQSGALAENQTNWIELTIQGPGLLSFWWKSSSEQGYDFLELLLDGVSEGYTLSGDTPWRQELINIPDGSHLVRWVYRKDGSVSGGQDAGWLDQVSYAPGSSGPETLLRATFDTGFPTGWAVTDNEASGAHWVFNDPGERGNSTGGAGRFAIIDSEFMEYIWVDTELITPALDLSKYTNVQLQFKTDLNIGSGLEVADIDIRWSNGDWENIWRRNTGLPGPTTISLWLTNAAGKANFQVRFHYYDALWEIYWEIDDIYVTATGTSSVAQSMVTAWRQAWTDFDRNYPYFTLKGIDWAPVFDANTNTFAQATNAVQFASALNDVLQIFRDWQILVARPGANPAGYDGFWTNNSPSNLLTSYTGGTPYQDLANAQFLYHARVGSNLAHIVVEHVNGFAIVSELDLDNFFSLYLEAPGMILDLRRCDGDDLALAERFASHFTTLPRTYGYTRTRIAGSDHDAFTPFAPRLLLPSTGILYTNPVICLIGQETCVTAEWLTLMLKSCPNVLLMGDHTRGASGDPANFTVSNPGVTYALPRSLGYTAQQLTFQDCGITPDLAFPPGPASYDDMLGRDYLLEHSLAWLKKPKLTILRDTPSGFVVSWPSETAYLYTLQFTTNLPSGPWLLAPGWLSNSPATSATMTYTNRQPRPFEAYRILMH